MFKGVWTSIFLTYRKISGGSKNSDFSNGKK